MLSLLKMASKAKWFKAYISLATSWHLIPRPSTARPLQWMASLELYQQALIHSFFLGRCISLDILLPFIPFSSGFWVRRFLRLIVPAFSHQVILVIFPRLIVLVSNA